MRNVSLPNSQSTRTPPEVIRDMTLISAPTLPAAKQRSPTRAGEGEEASLSTSASTSSSPTGIIPSSIPPT